MKLKTITVFAILAVLIFGYPIAYKSSGDVVTITIEDKERVTTGSGESISAKYIIYTDKGTFENTDTWIFGKWSSSDIQNDLKVGETYTVKTAGWRVPFMSMHRNIVKIKSSK